VKEYRSSDDLVDNPGLQMPVLNMLAVSNSDTLEYSIDASLTAYFSTIVHEPGQSCVP